MSAIGARYLEHHLQWRPVDGSFMGRRTCDALLPRADAQARSDEIRAIALLQDAVAAAPEASVAERLDKEIARRELLVAAAGNAMRPRWTNPAWYSGEAVFGSVSLLLPQSAPLDVAALQSRLRALPDFLADGRVRLAEARRAPAGWRLRAQGEALALAQFLRRDLLAIPDVGSAVRDEAALAGRALEAFAASVDALPDCDPAAGADYLQAVMRELHGIEDSPDALLAQASSAYARLGAELEEDAARLTPGQTWRAALESLTASTPAAGGVLAAYRHWHDRAAALAQSAQLVTPAQEYGLEYRVLDAPLRALAAATYFLFYRSPPALRPGAGSVYWVMPPGDDTAAYLRSQNDSVLKTTHTVHHGSIGHHTQNARARVAPGVLARLAGTDCASGIALLSAGTMVEGWACYAEDLLREAGDFYTPAEQLLLKQNERRNAASVLVDINLHLQRWSLAEAAKFYRDAGFAPQRVVAETVRNSMFPGSRLMYWYGVESIKALRRDSPLGTREFHDTLLGFGHVPVALAAAEMARQDPRA